MPSSRDEQRALALLQQLERPALSEAEATLLLKRLRSVWNVALPLLLTRAAAPQRTVRRSMRAALLELIRDEDVPALRRAIEDLQVPDLGKMEAFGALLKLGQAVDPNVVVEHLQDPEATFQVLQEDLLEDLIDDSSRPGESVHALMTQEAPVRHEIIDRLAETGDVRALRVLLPLLFTRSPETALRAVAAVERLGFREGATSLEDLGRCTTRLPLREAAATAADCLRAQGRCGYPALPPVYRAVATMIDGAGAQSLILLRWYDDESVSLANFLWRDDWGLRDAEGAWRMPVAQAHDLLAAFAEEDMPLFNVDAGYVRAAVLLAKELSASNRKPLPEAYAAWELLLGQPEADDMPERLEATTPPWAPGQLNELVTASPRLLARPEFAGWCIDTDQLQPHSPSLRAAMAQRPRREWLRALGNLVASEALPAVATPAFLETLVRRLRRQACLLRRAGDRQVARPALAAATTLEPTQADITPWQDPFLREMVLYGIAAAAGFDPRQLA
jgi:hypothetical protein